MALATSNRARVRYLKETTFAVPAGAAGKETRMTGEALTYAKTTDTSKELRSDRQISDLVPTGASASGAINFEFSYKEYDEFMAAIMTDSAAFRAYTPFPTATPLAFTTSVLSGASLPVFTVGAVIVISGFTGAAAANNGRFTVLTSTTTALTINAASFTAVTSGLVTGPGGAIIASITPATASFAPTTLTCTTNSDLATLVAGQWVVVSGFTGDSAANNGPYRVLTATSTVLTVFGTTPFAYTGSGVGTGVITPANGKLKNNVSTENFSYTIERALLDLASPMYNIFTGMVPSKMSLSASSGSIVTGSFDFMGKNMVEGDLITAQFTSATASQTYPVINAVSGAGLISIDGKPQKSVLVKSFKFDVDNKLRSRDAIGVLGAASIGYGTFEAKGDLEVYLEDATLYNKFLNNSDVGLAMTVLDSSGNGYIFEFPKANFSDAKSNAGGLDSDMMLALPFTALYDTNAATGCTMIIHRIGA